MKRLPWSVTCLSPARRQGELFATQNPDGSLVFSAVLKDEQGSLSFLLVPPSAPAQLVDWSLGTRRRLATARSPCPTFGGRWSSFASDAADAGGRGRYSVTRLVGSTPKPSDLL